MSAATTRTRLIRQDETQLHRPKRARSYEQQFPLESLKPNTAVEHIKIRCGNVQGRVLKRGIGSKVVWGKLRAKYGTLRGGQKLLGKLPMVDAVVEFSCDCATCRRRELARLKRERGFEPTRRAGK